MEIVYIYICIIGRLNFFDGNIRICIFYVKINRIFFKIWEKMLFIVLKIVVYLFFIVIILRIFIILWKVLKS